MSLTFLEIKNLRNIDSLCLKPSNHLNIIFGKNGSGKTSLLEAIYVLSMGRSFRTQRTDQLIQAEQDGFTIFGKVENHRQKLVKIGITYTRDTKTIKKDGVELKSAAELVKEIPVIIINPDIHKLIEEGPRYRRQFLDWGVFHVEHEFGPEWKKFSKLLKQRNASLRSNWAQNEIKHWDIELTATAERLNGFRKNYLESYIPVAEGLIKKHGQLRNIGFDFYSGWNQKESYRSALSQSWERDRELGFTNLGPHKADLRIKLNGHLARETVSRGQQKVLATLMRLAQVQIHDQSTPNQAIIMIDDLPAELDSGYRQQLLELFLSTKAQLFITTTERSLLDSIVSQHNPKMFHVKRGEVVEVI